MRIRSVSIAIFCLISLSSFSATDLDRVVELKLENGMKFLLLPRGEAPIFTSYIRFRVGGMDEEKGKTGLAHFVEHMAFKGTESLDEKALVQLIEREGGKEFNATTSRDITTYMVSFPSDKLRFWAEIESQRIFHPVFRDFERERNVILEERRMRVDNNPHGRLAEEFTEKAFASTPFEWPVLGYPDDLKRITLDDLRSFWESHYHPANAVGVIVGKFSIEEAKRILQEAFGKISPKPLQKETLFKKHAFEKEISFEMDGGKGSRIQIGYLKPPLPDRDDYVFDLIHQILGEGRGSRLYRSLILGEKVASEVEASTQFPGNRGPNLFFVEIEPLREASPEKALQLFDEEMKNFCATGPTEKEIKRAINRLLVETVWGLKTNEDLAWRLSFFEIAAGDWRYLKTYPEVIQTISREEIIRVSQKYLCGQPRIVGIMR